jgi:hypothetical protein
MKGKQTLKVLERKIKELGLGDRALLKEIGQWTIDEDKLPLFDLENLELTEEGITHFVERYKAMGSEIRSKAQKLSETKKKYSALKPFHKLFRRLMKNVTKGKMGATMFVLGKARRDAVVDLFQIVGIVAEVDGKLVHIQLGNTNPYPFAGYVAWTLCTGFVGSVAAAISLLVF